MAELRNYVNAKLQRNSVILKNALDEKNAEHARGLVEAGFTIDIHRRPREKKMAEGDNAEIVTLIVNAMTEEDEEILAKTLYREAGNESDKTKKAIAWVAMNRIIQIVIDSSRREAWGEPTIRSVCGHLAVTSVATDEVDDRIFSKIKKLLKTVFEGEDHSKHCDHFTRKDGAAAAWMDTATKIHEVDNFVFYRSNDCVLTLHK